MKAFLLFAAAVALAAPSASAYPIFFKCDAHGSMTEMLTPAELQVALSKLVSAVGQAKATEMVCQGSKECEAQLRQLNLLSAIAHSASQEDAIAVKAVHEDDFKLQKSLLANARMLSECRGSELSRDPANFELPNGNLLTYFPNNNVYAYAMGCRYGVTGLASKATYKKAIDNAVAAGVDPYVALSLGMLEGGINGIAGLYLDPVARFTAMGCPVTAKKRCTSCDDLSEDNPAFYACVKKHPDDWDTACKDIPRTSPEYAACDKQKSEDELHWLNSFGGCYQFKPGIAPGSAELGKRFGNYMAKMYPGRSKSGKSYACRKAKGDAVKTKDEDGDEQVKGSGPDADIQFKEKIEPTDCCVELPFDLSDSDGTEFEQFLVYENARKVQDRPSTYGADPAFHLQAFNGFSKLMGGTEGVSAWRSGVDYTKTPEYGYQGMDFILNTLSTNPVLRKMVKDAEQSLGTRSTSILCQGKAAGPYYIDSDAYSKQSSQAPRMGTIVGKSWAAMTKSERKVILNELNTVSDKLEEKGFKGEMNVTNEADIEKALKLYWGPPPYKSGIYAKRATIKGAALQDLGSQGYTWSPYTDEELKACALRVRSQSRGFE